MIPGIEKLQDLRAVQALIWQWMARRSPEWATTTPPQRDMAAVIQRHRAMRDKPTGQRIHLRAYRECGKTATGVAYILWDHLWHPERRSLISSAGGRFASDISKWILEIVGEHPVFAHMRPREDQRKSVMGFSFGNSPPSKDPSVVAVGIDGQSTGRHCHNVILDDIETDQNIETPHLLQKVMSRMKEFENIAHKQPDSIVIVFGTPHGEESSYNSLEERGYTSYFWPLRFPTEDLSRSWSGRLGPLLAEQLAANPTLSTGGGEECDLGQPADPTRANLDELGCRQIEVNTGPRSFRLNYLLDTAPADQQKYPLRLSQFMVMDIDHYEAPEKVVYGRSAQTELPTLPHLGFSWDRWYAPFQAIGRKPYKLKIMTIDTSAGGKDETAYSIVGFSEAQIFVMDNGGLRRVKSYDQDVMIYLAKKAIEYEVDLCWPEENLGQGAFTELFKNVLFIESEKAIAEGKLKKRIGVEQDPERRNWSRGMKELRMIETLGPTLSQHRLVMDRSLVERDYAQRLVPGSHLDSREYTLGYQVSHLYAKRGALPVDDRVETLSMAVSYFDKWLSVDRDRAIEMERKRKHVELVERFQSLSRDGVIVFGEPKKKKPISTLDYGRAKTLRSRYGIVVPTLPTHNRVEREDPPGRFSFSGPPHG